ncbi:MAG: phasin family protein [Deltaproteobacteria bacterium]|nr:phasin family protein [Deltaproteobacteria bacterium]
MLQPKAIQESIGDVLHRLRDESQSALRRADEEWKSVTGYLVECGKLTQSEAQKIYDEWVRKLDRNRADLERRFQTGAKKTLTRLNIPTKNEVDDLSRRVESLSQRVKTLKKQLQA